MSKEEIKKKIEEEVKKYNALQKAIIETLGGIKMLNKLLEEEEKKEEPKVEEEKMV